MRGLKSVITTLAAVALFANTQVEAKPKSQFEPTWESLTKYEVPEWWQNTKFGIYFHWGPYSVPGYQEWYSHWMYLPDSWNKKITQFHNLVFGGAEKFGYKDFVPMFTG
ncbi:MAG: alpha-L-fucosidase, partial [Rikenellaceae bacterium]